MNGAVGVSNERKEMRVSYRGDAALGSVRMLDKVTNDSFLRWNSFSANGINFSLGSGPPKVHVAALDLGNFYARIILNADGRLNLRDVTASPEEARTSLTRAHGAPGATRGTCQRLRRHQHRHRHQRPAESGRRGSETARPRQVRPQRRAPLRFRPTSQSGGLRFTAARSTTPTTSSSPTTRPTSPK